MWSRVKLVTHLAILYTDRGDARKSPGVPGAAIAVFADRRDRRIKSHISGMSDISDLIRRHSPSLPVLPIFSPFHCESPVKLANQVGRYHHMTFQKKKKSFEHTVELSESHPTNFISN